MTHASLRTQIQHKAGPHGAVADIHTAAADRAVEVDAVRDDEAIVEAGTQPPETVITTGISTTCLRKACCYGFFRCGICG